MDRLTAMKAFIRVVESGSFTRVAEEFDTGQPTISKWISGLEKHLGVRLFNRNTRKIELTAAGQSYFKRCHVIINEVEFAEAEIQQGEVEPKGLLRISLPSFFSRQFIVPMLRVFRERYPGIGVDLVMTDLQVDMIAEGIDLAIRFGDLPSSSLVAKRLACYRRVLVASPAYIESRGTPGHISELEQHTCLIHTLLFKNEEWRFVKNGKPESVHVQGDLRVNNGDALVQLAVDGFGIAYLPDFMVRHDVGRGRLVNLLPEYQSEQRKISMVYLQKKFMPVAMRCFIEVLEETLATIY